MAFQSGVRRKAFQIEEVIGEKMLRGEAYGRTWTGKNFPILLESR